MSDLASGEHPPGVRDDGDGAPVAAVRVPGHVLLAEGEAYLAVDCYTDRCSTNVGATTHQRNSPTVTRVGGAGHGVCSCGILSAHEPSGAARRRWHRRHKARVLMDVAEPAGQPSPVRPEAIA